MERGASGPEKAEMHPARDWLVSDPQRILTTCENETDFFVSSLPIELLG